MIPDFSYFCWCNVTLLNIIGMTIGLITVLYKAWGIGDALEAYRWVRSPEVAERADPRDLPAYKDLTGEALTTWWLRLVRALVVLFLMMVMSAIPAPRSEWYQDFVQLIAVGLVAECLISIYIAHVERRGNVTLSSLRRAKKADDESTRRG